jgi:hypothetical protein
MELFGIPLETEDETKRSIPFLKRAQALVTIASRLGPTKTALELDDLLIASIRRRCHRTALLRRLAELASISLLPPAS